MLNRDRIKHHLLLRRGEKHLGAGIISMRASGWALPTVLVRKRDDIVLIRGRLMRLPIRIDTHCPK